ncbi:mechanosensitive ion channel family protein [Cupriavidus basilensis]|uniref:Mechanosensitive ion channel family protein n=1 Tax=Cupriavidus basilensis TaxID=68895 RepID=A0ABT6B1Y3_9BURK|nr:mechanosensitive ion channel family protein [Cupriavidus basilensis]MDF3838734.1 mechanosensitive ion channel family protein [Cupriavidus basilensis]
MNLPFNDSYLLHIGLSAGIVLAGMLAVKFINRFFQARQQGDKDNRGSYRTWTVASRNVVGAVVFLLLLGIWVSELKSVAISLTAFAVALVIGGKELVMCFLGAFLRMMARPFQLGDIVEIGPYSGEVADMDALTTTLVEIAGARQFTGSTVQIPNSMLLTSAVRNHSQSGKYTLETLRIPLPEKSDPDRVEATLIGITEQVCAPFLDEARHSLQEYGGTRFLDLSQFEPRVMFEAMAADRLDVLVRFPVPVASRLSVGQQILRRYHLQRIAEAAAQAASGAAGASPQQAGAASAS